ncbi:MAG: hypothetical protein US83_C0006G0044 [Candidatus Falkowbacteria bacterium GW2011_GWC2_38_22]|uniref:DUF916 domain-containing protein n=1 Tax=Candidatus Falkowbacteria bacterium GW2011_GWE1_38_31 TaxID=1618638 RepID=A0A0G0JUE7_9BACT|nr:MAG: hypothetical protein US73_C0001G0045 [Candidatus Falkowbacteria bacterium GW2011_GWF2_38_1205]KKQ61404.1 MAG: hypothetical protein US83_C0006G0044 [Candidatus Falkowbacteria bacterium GW2011_GWC2_38_22]KKQ64013.1 MAG: hypothetical protein US84_C0002G0045 [Candidatus Falkowbacteria bacterium GW2011_GWF1_38_22]KKQ66639.1 MAG: hypothetical protein US87_C0001G0160 [Candidatus Falkowbacteria bacterium GW2011_GWE2_38_254]KKQ71118.1 MAG: hypothetical protein US91_C0001G0045 [Candidatus Falkowb
MTIKKGFLFVVALTAIIFFKTDIVFAQEGAGIKISPVRIEEMVDPGQALHSEVSVTNESGEAKTFYVYLRDFKSEGESGSARLIEPGTEEGNYLASWIVISNEGTLLQSGETKTFPFQVIVPAEVGPGGYFGAIVFGTEPPRIQMENEDKGAGMAIAQQTACLVLLRVKGDVYEDAQIVEFNTDKDFYSTPFSVDFTVRIENIGNVHIKPRGSISIKNMFGKEVSIVKINEKGGNILPKSIRNFGQNFWNGDNAFGKYTASLGITYGVSADEGGQGKNSLVSVKTFWIIPWRILIPITLILLFISGTFMLFIRLYKNKAVRKAMERAGLPNVRYVKTRKNSSPTVHFMVILVIVFIMMFILLSGLYFLFFS